jgi:uncharacterized protein YdgA (DUF945 family)
VDLRLPVDSNPFFVAMRDSAEGAQLLSELHDATRRATSHTFVIGRSGMGTRR